MYRPEWDRDKIDVVKVVRLQIAAAEARDAQRWTRMLEAAAKMQTAIDNQQPLAISRRTGSIGNKLLAGVLAAGLISAVAGGAAALAVNSGDEYGTKDYPAVVHHFPGGNFCYTGSPNNYASIGC